MEMKKGSKALHRIPKSKRTPAQQRARADYKQDDSDERAADTFDRAEPFERRPYTHNSATTADKHSFAADQGESSRQRKKIRGRKETEQAQATHRKYLKSTLQHKHRLRLSPKNVR